MTRLILPTALLLLVAAPALAGPPQAVMEARNYVARRLTADYHLQVEPTGVEDLGGLCRVEGKVVRRFAAPAEALPPGAAVVFAMPCAAEGFWPVERLKSARLVEVFLRKGLTGLEIADEGQGLLALEAPSDAPMVHDDPALVREMTETIAGYSIDTEAKRNNPDGALALARVSDLVLRVRLLAHAAASFAAQHLKAADAAGAETLAAFEALPPGPGRLETGLAAVETLALGGAKPATLRLADLLLPEVEALTDTAGHDAALLVLYGARTRADDPAAALTALSRVSSPKTRRERLEDMPFAQKEFGAANPASAAWMDRLLTAAEAQPDAGFRGEATLALCRTAYRAAAGLVENPALAVKAIPMMEQAARRHHGPSAVLLAVLVEVAGGVKARPEAARWYAVAGVGFDVSETAAAEAGKILAGFTPSERAAAARLLGGAGAATPKRLLELAKK